MGVVPVREAGPSFALSGIDGIGWKCRGVMTRHGRWSAPASAVVDGRRWPWGWQEPGFRRSGFGLCGSFREVRPGVPRKKALVRPNRREAL